MRMEQGNIYIYKDLLEFGCKQSEPPVRKWSSTLPTNRKSWNALSAITHLLNNIVFRSKMQTQISWVPAVDPEWKRDCDTVPSPSQVNHPPCVSKHGLVPPYYGHQSFKRELNTHVQDSHCGMDDHKPLTVDYCRIFWPLHIHFRQHVREAWWDASIKRFAINMAKVRGVRFKFIDPKIGWYYSGVTYNQVKTSVIYVIPVPPCFGDVERLRTVFALLYGKGDPDCVLVLCSCNRKRWFIQLTVAFYAYFTHSSWQFQGKFQGEASDFGVAHFQSNILG